MTSWTDRLITRPRIAIDMDHVMADTGAALTDWLGQTHELTFDTAHSFGTLRQSLAEPYRQLMIDYVAHGAMFRGLPVFAGCREVVEALNDRYAVLICTAAMEYPNGIAAKIEWLREEFPFLDPLQFVFCGPKQMMAVDYLIDDSPKHFPGFQGTPILYTAPHNRAETRYHRVDNWSDIARYFLED